MPQKSYLLERARAEGTPLIDGRVTANGRAFASDGADIRATFVWRGKTAPALTGDFKFWAGDHPGEPSRPIQLKQVEPNVWATTLRFPRNAYIEYVFVRNRKRVNDPLNLHLTPNGIGGINNFFYGPLAHPTPYLATSRGIARGSVTTLILEAPGMLIGNTRRVHLYQPPTATPAALLVALDGQDYLRRAKLPLLLDNLYAQGKIAPVAAAMLESSQMAQGTARMSEYGCNQLTHIFLLKRLIPLAQEQLRLVEYKKHPGAYGIAGGSMGGLMAVFTALRAPEVFGTAISHAGAFEFWDLAASPFMLAPLAKVRPHVWLDVGQMDWLLESNRRMKNMLRRLKFDLKYREYYAYHNWPAWRNALPEALQWAFPRTA